MGPASPEGLVGRWSPEGGSAPAWADDPDFLDVLRYYESVGVDPTPFRSASAEEILHRVNDHLRDPQPHVPAAEAQALAGLDDADLAAFCAAAGYQADQGFTAADVDALAAFGVALSMFTRDELLYFVRVLAQTMDRVANAATSLFRIDIVRALESEDAPTVEFVRKNHEVAALLEQLFVPLRAFFFRSLRTAVPRSDLGALGVDSGATTTVAMTVGFVDLAGYTATAERLAPDDLARYLLDFETRAAEAVGRHGGQLVKLIGDEVMYATVEPGDAVAIAADLIHEGATSAARPGAGVAWGEVVARGGDYHGRPVNLAARAAGIAPPGVVVTDALTAGRAGGWRFDALGPTALKGFSEPVEMCSLPVTPGTSSPAPAAG